MRLTLPRLRAAASTFDPVLMVATVALSVLGVTMIYSASAIAASASDRMGHDEFYYASRQLSMVVFGLILMAITSRIPYQIFAKLVRVALFAAILLLVLIYVPGLGRETNGATRWLDLGGFSFQPSEFAKFALVLYLAKSLAYKKDNKVRHFTTGVLSHGLVTLLLASLIVFQPDLGTPATMFAILFFLMFMAGTRISHLAIVIIPTILVLALAIRFKAYRLARFMSFRDPFQERFGVGYQLCESLISIGSGGLFGHGLGEGHKKLYFLPESHTDFVFAVVGEELGFVGICLLLVLFAIWIVRGITISVNAVDAFGQLMALGITFSIGFQAFFNMAVAMGMLPTKGLPMPFVSYGRTSLLMTFVATGVLMNIHAGGVGRDARERGGANRRLQDAPRPATGGAGHAAAPAHHGGAS